MAERFLDNLARLDGDYGGLEFENSASTQVTVRLLEIPFTKTADQSIWFNGPLTFTLTIDNTVPDSPGILTDIVIRDQLDTTMFTLDESSIVARINNNVLELGTDYTVSYTAGLLTITFNSTVAVETNEIMTVTFQGNKTP